MEDKKLTGKVYDIQGFSVHDGPGLRNTLSKAARSAVPGATAPNPRNSEPS
jgi:hypothetical protein